VLRGWARGKRGVRNRGGEGSGKGPEEVRSGDLRRIRIADRKFRGASFFSKFGMDISKTLLSNGAPANLRWLGREVGSGKDKKTSSPRRGAALRNPLRKLRAKKGQLQKGEKGELLGGGEDDHEARL